MRRKLKVCATKKPSSFDDGTRHVQKIAKIGHVHQNISTFYTYHGTTW